MKHISMQSIFLVALTASLALPAQAHERMSGPLPKEILEHRDDIGQLQRYAGLEIDDTAKGLFGLHYYYAQDLDAQRLTLKLLNSEDIGAQMAALRIIGHCGGETHKDIFTAISSRLGVLSSSEDPEVRKLGLEVKRTFRKFEKDRRNRIPKKTERP